MFSGLYLPNTPVGSLFADPRGVGGLDPALSPILIADAGRTLTWRLEFTDAAGAISRLDPGTCNVEVFQARIDWRASPVGYEWALYGPARTGVTGQSAFWDAALPGYAYTYRVSNIGAPAGTHYRLWVREND